VLALAFSGAAAGSSGGAGMGRTAPHKRAQGGARKARSDPFAGRGMWIWELPLSGGGNLGSIIATSHRYGISTLMIKSGDGTSVWSQFNSGIVSALHASGLRVCAWQYVYGRSPAAEAQVAAAAVSRGADCLLIDAESQYEGRYVQAQTYITQLRRLIGGGFPVALAGFPWIDFHPAFPYSVFLGPGGAQYNVPQMYWFDIGTSVDNVYSHTYKFNRLYRREIDPLGQLSGNPPPRQIRRFRQLSLAYGAPGVSWWDWQEASARGWSAISQAIGWPSGFTPYSGLATLRRGAHGDFVVWAQEHLISAGYKIRVDGAFGAQTRSAVARFQASHGLQASGVIGSLTWQALLRYPAAHVRWTKSGARTARFSLTMPVPRSAHLPAKRYEIPRSLGAGRPPR